MINIPHTWPYIDIFRKYKDNINVFVETGTHYGASIEDALTLDFKKILSVDISIVYYDHCLQLFEEEIRSRKVTLFLGDSRNIFPLMLEEVYERAMFWLDAHQDATFTVYSELGYLMTHPIKNHTIIIDDIPLYFDEVGKVNLQRSLLNINKNYRIDYYPMHGHSQYQMIAYE